MSWTQGVEGLNLKKKAQRKEKGEVLVKEDAVHQNNNPEEDATLQYYVPDDVANMEEVEGTSTIEEEQLVENTETETKIRVINTYFEA